METDTKAATNVAIAQTDIHVARSRAQRDASGWRNEKAAWVAIGVAWRAFFYLNFAAVLLGVAASGSAFGAVDYVYAFSTIYFPIALGAVFAFSLYCAWAAPRRNGRLLLASLFCGFSAVSAVSIRYYATNVEPWRLTVRKETLASPRIARPIRLLHITDIQTPGSGPYEARAFERMRELEPDLIIHTGDLIQPIIPVTRETEEPKMAALFETLRGTPSLGMFNVYGNVDRDWPPEMEKDFGGLRTLVAESTSVAYDGGEIQLLGLTFGQSASDCTLFVRNWLATLKPGDFRIVAGHSPDFTQYIQDLDVDLILAGHTHGGQIRLPIIGPLATASSVPRSWARGWRRIGEHATLNVSAGVGAEHAAGMPSIRLNCPPEMSLIELLPTGEQ